MPVVCSLLFVVYGQLLRRPATARANEATVRAVLNSTTVAEAIGVLTAIGGHRRGDAQRLGLICGDDLSIRGRLAKIAG